MMMTQRYPRVSGAVYRGGAGLLLAGGVALAGVGLMRWHAARYGLAPLNLTPWLPSLLAFLVGVALLGAGIGGWLYVRRQWRAGARRRLDNTLLVVGALLILFNVSTALDLTVTPPATATGQVTGIGQTIWPLEQMDQYNMSFNGQTFTVTQDVYHTDGGQCVTVVYGPRSQIAFAVTLIPFGDLSKQRQFCGESAGG